jgi:ADP-heptose:LPS heptosyltransferase
VQANRHQIDLHFDLLDALSPGARRSYATVMKTADEQEVLDKFHLKGCTYIVVQVSATNGNRSPKVWPLDNFRLLVERLHDEGFTIVLAGDKLEEEIVDRFARETQVPAVNLAGKTSVQEVAAVIKHAAALVGHDSGLMHIGDALGTPLVALYGPTDYAYTRPRGEKSVVIRKDLPCAPCMANFAKTEQEVYRDCPIEFECMKRISVEEVFEAVMKQARVSRSVDA